MTEFDDTLTRLFAEVQEEALPPDGFLAQLAARMHRDGRRRAIQRLAWRTVAAAVAAAATPYVAGGTLGVASHLGVWLAQMGNALTSPAGWACSLLIAAWGMRRVRST